MTDTNDLIQPFYNRQFSVPQMEQNLGFALDSLFPIREQQALLQRPSLLQPDLVTPTHSELLLRQGGGFQPWVFVVLCLLTAAIIVYFQVRKLRLRWVVASMLNNRSMRRLVRRAGLTPSRLAPVGVLLAAMVAMCLYRVGDGDIGPLGVLVVTVVVAMAYLLRWAAMRFVAKVFDATNAVAACLTSSYLYHLNLVCLTVPLLFPLFYMPGGKSAMLIVIVVLTVLTLIMRLVRGVRLFFSLQRSVTFNLFCYLCIVEIAPLIVVLGWFFAQ